MRKAMKQLEENKANKSYKFLCFEKLAKAIKIKKVA